MAPAGGAVQSVSAGDGAPQTGWRLSVRGGSSADLRPAAVCLSPLRMSVSGMKKQLHKASQVNRDDPGRTGLMLYTVGGFTATQGLLHTPVSIHHTTIDLSVQYRSIRSERLNDQQQQRLMFTPETFTSDI